MTPAYPYPDPDPQLAASMKFAAHLLNHHVPVDNLPDYLQHCVPPTPNENQSDDQDEEPQAAPIPRWLSRYVERGFDLVFWSRLADPKNDWKGPRDPSWPNKSYLAADYREGMQVGVKLGIEIAPGRFLWDADLDWAEGIRHAARFMRDTGFAFGRKSKPLGHAFFTSSAPVVSEEYKDTDGTMLVERRGLKKDGTGVGRQTMLPPSIHRESGEIVTLACDGDIAHDDAAVDGLTLYAVACLLGRHWPKNGPTTNQHLLASYVAGFLVRKTVDPDTIPIIVEVAATIGKDDNVEDRVRFAKDTVKKYQAGEAKIPGRPKLAKELGKDVVSLLDTWLESDSTFIRVEGKIVQNSQENLRRALAMLKYEVSYNTFSEKFMVNGAPLGDPELVEIWARIDEECKFRPDWEFYQRMIRRIAWNNPYHPVCDYLDKLVWDGEPRINTWLVEYGGAVDMTEQSDADDSLSYLQAISSIVLIAAVRRIRHPGCKYDEMVVLESPQGWEKSSAIRALCGNDEWFSDDLALNVRSKELIEHTLGKWIIEASDLSGKRKSERGQLKAMLSRQVDGPVRKAYGWMPSERRRQFIFIGTTNDKVNFDDPTGARRFWPVEVQRFNVAGIKTMRDQLWAEAAHREAAGESIRLPERLWPDAEREQEKRREIDPWEDVLRTFLDEVKPRGDGYRRVTTEALWGALGITTERRDRYGATRISETMQRLKFIRTRVYDDDTKKVVVGYSELEASGLGRR